MSQDINIILTMEDYFDIIDFDNKPPRDKVAYMLYYVTCVARLRKDMIPEIISDRINDQYKLYLKRTHLKKGDEYEKMSRNAVIKIMKNNPNYFAESTYGIIDKSDRKKNDIAYVLTDDKYKQIDAEFDKKVRKRISNINKVRGIELSFIVLLLLFAIFIVISTLYGLFGFGYEEIGSKSAFWKIEQTVPGFAGLLSFVFSILSTGFWIGSRWRFTGKM